MSRFVIIDYGVGNLRSVQKAFEAVGVAAEISSSPAAIDEATALILPGVGAFGDCIINLRQTGLDAPLMAAAHAGKPLLGICVGLQLLFEESEEMGRFAGLGLLPGKIVRFPPGLPVPHMGWNQIEPLKEDPLLKDVPAGSFAYFAHSYYAKADDPDCVTALTDYGLGFASVVHRQNIYAIQFHPEKSQKVGLQILKNFAACAEAQGRKIT
jgi:imidazole glycerol-phosphate synthase subunit HisH